jgi:hypothetical protein
MYIYNEGCVYMQGKACTYTMENVYMYKGCCCLDSIFNGFR